MSDIFQDWQVYRDLLHYDTLSTVSNGQVHIEIGGDITPEEQAQIAYLVKAAPEMLEALKKARQYVYWASAAGYADAVKMNKRIGSIIDKAEGRQP
jgi:hypothetical protein